MSHSYYRGHPVIYENGDWFFKETNIDINETTWLTIPCKKCGELPTEEGHDHCLGPLPNIEFACCGHGNVEQAYIKFYNDELLYGQEALDWIKENKS